MNIILTDIKCKNCGAKLTEYEAEDKEQYCMDCYEEVQRT